MPVVKCPIEGCEYETPDIEPVIAAALITVHATSHQTPSQPTQMARVEKGKRPSTSSAGTTEDWQYFTSRWGDYVKATKLEGTDKVIQLLECCDEQLRKDLTRNARGSLTGMTKDQVLKAMKTLAIREENTMVARVTLHNMRQDHYEPVRAFGAMLRGKASVQVHTEMPKLRGQCRLHRGNDQGRTMPRHPMKLQPGTTRGSVPLHHYQSLPHQPQVTINHHWRLRLHQNPHPQ